MFRLDRDIDGLVVDEQERYRERIRLAATRAEEVHEASDERRLAEWFGWLTTFRDSLEPLRHPILRLATSEAGENRQRDCETLAAGLSQVPASIRAVPAEVIDVDGLELALSRVQTACTEERWIQVVLEARSTGAYWREIDRTLQLLAIQYRSLL